MRFRTLLVSAVYAICSFSTPATADAVSDWNEKAESFVVAGKMPPPRAGRATAMVQIAVFEALNSITPRYRPYRASFPVHGNESPDAAVAAAAAGVMARLDPEKAQAIQTDLAQYVASLPPGAAREYGLKLGDAAAAAIVADRAHDGSDAPDRYRPATPPGVYVPTAPVAVPHWPGVTPFAIQSAAAFRPPPPVSLTSPTWSLDLAEIRAYGGRDSTLRSPRQSEDAKFWLTVGPQAYLQVERQIPVLRKLTGVDAARFMAVAEIARADAILAVFDAKYHYGFWRPITAVRASSEADAGWQPIDSTPAHPEYPCAHCISAASLAAVVQRAFGSDTVPELTATSPTAPGVTHRWTSLRALTREVSEARIWAGFHYRFSTRIAEDMGWKIGDYVDRNTMQPLKSR
jgi:hypothetical protein